MATKIKFSKDVLEIDEAKECAKIEAAVRQQVFHTLKKRGAVLGLSGGIDSSVSSALCARALGKNRVLGIFMPEEDSSDESLAFGKLLAKSIGIEAILENISPPLKGVQCYERRDAAIKLVVPDYTPQCKSKIVIPSILDDAKYAVFSVVVQYPDGRQTKTRLTAEAYLGIVAATNFKQRVRRMMEYYHADRLNYAVVGTPNRLEYDQAFFVKNGDGAADFKPIAHLYKTQVYRLAKYMNLPKEIQNRTPTTDTYSLSQTQDEFYFSMSLEKFDLCLYGKNHGVSAGEVAEVVGFKPEQVEHVYQQIDKTRQNTRYMHMRPLLVEEVKEIQGH